MGGDGKSEYAAEALAFLRAGRFGVLSTNGGEPAGYPFGSVVPYSLDQANRPVILISSIAAHIRNIQGDSRDYHRTHDFAYYRLEPARARWIGGFGRIAWIEASEFAANAS